MPRKIDGILYYTKAEIDQLQSAGYVASIANRNAVPVLVSSSDWSAQVGGAFDGWQYADVVHGQSKALIAYIGAFTGADSSVHICSGINDWQETQSTTTIRLWIKDSVSYDILCIVHYA